METREIIVKDTKTQKVSRIQTAATNVSELMEAMKTAGIDYSGMTITEGITKTTFLDPSSPLPQNVMFKGRQTNSLFILLTNTQKNIASGASNRQEAYRLVKMKGLQDAIKEEFGRNYTQVPTDKLFWFIQHGAASPVEETPVEGVTAEVKVDDVPAETPSETPCACVTPSLSSMADAIYGLIKAAVKENKIQVNDLELIADMTSDLAKQMKEAMPLSEKEIEELSSIEI